MSDYDCLIERKAQAGSPAGFTPSFMPDFLFDFQRDLVDWSVRMGRSALLCDCGLGKTPMQLVWAQNVVENAGPVLILTPLAVGAQTALEGEKFGVECMRSHDGKRKGPITIANYERLHLFDPADYAGVVCDESSILKSFDGARRNQITDFMRKVRYRLLCTATAAPNDYIELGTSSEAIGNLGHMDMLAKFFKNDQNNSSMRRFYGEAPKWRFKGHAEIPFWRWVTSWARAVRKPSDLGYDDGPFTLPALTENQRDVSIETAPDGLLFNVPAATLPEQRAEKRRTIHERCERAAALVAHTGKPAVIWCQLNDEGDFLERMIPGAVQVSGADRDAVKEERFTAFQQGQARVLITKPKIGAWGLNWQHCAHVVYFPSHSYEQYYQAVRRCWRFGQTSPVTVDIPLTEGERLIMANLSRKADQAQSMFSNLVAEMNQSIAYRRQNDHTQKEVIPAWLA